MDNVIVKFEAELGDFKSQIQDLRKRLEGLEGSAQGVGNEVETSAKKSQAGFNTIGKGTDALKKQFLALGSTIVGALAIGKLTSIAVTSIKEFEVAVDNLSAITGATGDDLKFLSDRAIELGAQTSISAKEVTDAFKLVASAKPELLDNAAALDSVTTAAVTLAEAGTISIEDAVRGLTSSLNQFGLGAEDAQRAIDVLAAGSKFGSAGVADLSETFKNAGAVASAAGLTLEDLAAASEVLAAKSLQGAEAGTALRGIILRLQKQGVGFVDGQFNINAALTETQERLDAIQDPAERTAEATKLVGEEGATALNILLANQEGLRDFQQLLNEEAEGTAGSQAITNTENLSTAVEKLKNTYESFILSLDSGEGAFGSLLTNIISTVSEVLRLVGGLEKAEDSLTENEQRIREYAETVVNLGKFVGVLVSSIVAYRVAVVASTVAQTAFNAVKAAYTLITQGATVAQRAFNVATRANPVGLLVGVLTAAVSAYALFRDGAKEATDAQKELNKTIEEGNRINEAVDSIETRVNTIDRLNKSQLENLKRDIAEEIRVNEEKEAEIIRIRQERAGSIRQIEEQTKRNVEQTQREIAEIEQRIQDEGFSIQLKKEKDRLQQRLQEQQSVVEDILRSETGLVDNEVSSNQKRLRSFNDLVEEKLKGIEKVDKKESDNSKKRLTELEALKKEQAEINTILQNQALTGNINQQLIDRYNEITATLKKAEEDLKAALAGINDARDSFTIKPKGIDTDSLNKGGTLVELDADTTNIDKARDEKLAKDAQADQDRLDAQRIINDQILSSGLDVADALFDIQQQRREEELISIDNNLQQQQDLLQRSIDNGEISEAQFQERKQKLEEETDRKRREILRKQAIADKAKALFDIAIATSIAIAKGLATPAVPPFPSAIAAGIAGAVQAALVAAQPIPQFAEGGLIGGKLHKDGGTIIEAEKGEFIAKRKAVQAYLPELQAINNGNFDQLIYKDYVLPALKEAIQKDKEASNELIGKAIANNIVNNNFSDLNLLESDKKNRFLLNQINENLKRLKGTDPITR